MDGTTSETTGCVANVMCLSKLACTNRVTVRPHEKQSAIGVDTHADATSVPVGIASGICVMSSSLVGETRNCLA
jgi:hypothetical protein